MAAGIYQRDRLSEHDVDAMFRLHTGYYDRVRRETFLEDLSRKQWVILLRDEAGEVGGFSTMEVFSTSFRGRETVIVFSGDTVVDLPLRRHFELPGCFGHLMRRLADTHPGLERHWLLTTKGHRTYRFLPVFFRSFFPAPNGGAHADAAALVEHVARRKWPSRFDAGTGILRAEARADRLKPEHAPPPACRLQDPHIRFFLDHNPGYTQGDELVCLTSLDLANLNARGRYVIDHTHVEWHE